MLAGVTLRETEMKCGVLILFLLGVGSAQAAGDYRCLVSAAFQVNAQGERNEEILAPMTLPQNLGPFKTGKSGMIEP